MYILFAVSLLAASAGIYLFVRNSENDNQDVTQTPIATPVFPGELSLLMNNFDKAYAFHPIDPQKLPQAYYTNNKSLYDFLYSSGNIPIPFPKFNQKIVVNGQGCYLFEEEGPGFCGGIIEGLTNTSYGYEIQLGMLSLDNKYSKSKIAVNKSAGEGAIYLFDLNDKKIYSISKNGRKLNLLSLDITNLLSKEWPVFIALEADPLILGSLKLRETSVVYLLNFKDNLNKLGYTAE